MGAVDPEKASGRYPVPPDPGCYKNRDDIPKFGHDVPLRKVRFGDDIPKFGHDVPLRKVRFGDDIPLRKVRFGDDMRRGELWRGTAVSN